MKKLISIILALLLAGTAFAALADEALYIASVTKKMTIRASKSTSGIKLGSVEANEQVRILELDEAWAKIEKDGAKGYILSKNLTGLEAAAGYNDAGEALYTGILEKGLSIRFSKSKSAMKLAELKAGETIYILEIGKEWHKVIYKGVEGYVLASAVLDIMPARADVELPEGFHNRVQFTAYYTAQADVNLSIRQEKKTDSKTLGTVYEKEEVEVMETDGQWAYVRKGGAMGYVLASHLRYYKRLDPYGPFIPGVQWYPYAAHVLEQTPILDGETGELLRVVPERTILSVTALDEDMSVYLPYDRIMGKIEATESLQMEDVHRWDLAEPGDLIAVFSTYYDPSMDSQRNTGRLHNIQQGVYRLNGVNIAAGELFSFNEYCAPYSQGNGYELGPIINYTSSTNLGYGGGICQVSTTLYDAVLQIPIEIVKQQVHSSYGISYAPLDMDAAVGAGNIDFRIKNVLPYGITLRLQAVGGVLTVRVYRAKR